MAGDRPASKPIWATAPTADIAVPSGSKQAIGWVKEYPPHQWFNWLQNLTYQWIEWGQSCLTQYDEMSAAIEELESLRSAGLGDPLSAHVSENQTTDDTDDVWKLGSSALWDYAGNGAATERHCCTDGRWVFLTENLKLSMHRRSDGVLLDSTTFAANITSVACDGQTVVCTTGNYGAIIPYDSTLYLDMTSVQQYDHAAALGCCGVLGELIVFGGQVNGSSQSAATVDRASGNGITYCTMTAVTKVLITGMKPQQIYLVIGTWVHRFTLALGGASVHSIDHGAAINSLSRTRDGILLGGDPGTGTKHIRLLTLGALAEVWSRNITNTMKVGYDGHLCYAMVASLTTPTNDLPGNIFGLDPTTGNTIAAGDVSGSTTVWDFCVDPGGWFLAHDDAAGTPVTLSRLQTVHPGCVVELVADDQARPLPWRVVPALMN